MSLRYTNYVSELELITHEPTEYGLSITNTPSILYTKQSDDYIIYIIISLSAIVFAIIVYVKVRDPRPCF